MPPLRPQQQKQQAGEEHQPHHQYRHHEVGQLLPLLLPVTARRFGLRGFQFEILIAIGAFQIVDAQLFLANRVALLEFRFNCMQRRGVRRAFELDDLTLIGQCLMQVARLFGQAAFDLQQIAQLAVHAAGAGFGDRGADHRVSLPVLAQRRHGTGDVGAGADRIADAAVGRFLLQRSLRQLQRIMRATLLEIHLRQVVADGDSHARSADPHEMLARTLINPGCLVDTVQRGQCDAFVILGVGDAPLVTQRTIVGLHLATQRQRAVGFLVQRVGIA